MSALVKLERWKVVHEALVDVAVRRAALDADEMRWLYEAEQLQIWKQVGVVSMVDYLERVLGHAPRTAQERMRVARALADLPELMAALEIGELSFSAIKELVRVATRSTERAWSDAARGKNLREIERLVSGRRPGNLPTDLPDDDARLHTLRFDDVSASAYALFRQARQAIDRQNGSRVTDDQLVHTIARAILDGAGDSAAKPIDHGHARNQLHYTVCQHCERAWQDGGGERVRIDAATLAQARCDAVEIPRAIDGKPQRASQTIPPAIRREIFHRDENRCQTPGCRSTWGLEIHHILARADEGTHDPSNLTLRCGGCHTAHHEGKLVISGTAPDNLTTTRVHALSVSFGSPRAHHRPHQGAHVGVDRDDRASDRTTSQETPAPSRHDASITRTAPSRLDAAVTRTNAIAALTTSGWKRGIAITAVDDARAHIGATAPLDVLVREAFRRCGTRTTR
jgi:hypothetical protein